MFAVSCKTFVYTSACRFEASDKLGKVAANVNGFRKPELLWNFRSFDAKNISFLEITFKSVRTFALKSNPIWNMKSPNVSPTKREEVKMLN